MKKITILDLAKATGISKSTISRYLSNGSVSKDKSVIIEQKIQELGYVRNNFAEMLRTSKSNLIGVIVPDLKNPFFTNVVYEIENLADKKGITIIIKSSGGDKMKEMETIKYMSGFLVDAVVLCRSNIEYEDLCQYVNKMKFISIDGLIEGIDCVLSDNRKNGYLLTNHIIENVDGNVLFFRRDDERKSVIDRQEGFTKSCIENELVPHIYSYKNDTSVDFKNLQKYILKNNIRGIVCRNDNEAVKLMTNLTDSEVQLKYCGFDNIKLSRLVYPQLTTVDQNINKMCETVFEIIDSNSTDTRKHVIESKIIFRESSK